METERLLTLGKNPVSADKPTGNDAKYEPEYSELEAEIGKLSSVSAAGVINWNKVVELGEIILRSKSKDLKVATFLCIGLIETRQINGLALGLTILKDLIAEYWENLYPPPKKNKMTARENAIAWWQEKLDTLLKRMDFSDFPPIAGALMESMSNDLAEIDRLLADKLPNPPILNPLQRLLDRIPIQVEEKAETEPSIATAESEAQTPPAESEKPVSAETTLSQPESAPKVASPPATQKSAPPSPPRTTSEIIETSDSQEVKSDKEALSLLDAAGLEIQKAASALRKINSAHPKSYQFTRIAAWHKITALPPSENGKTKVTPPDSQIRNSFVNLREQGKLNDIINSAEQNLSRFIFWLDLNRYSAEALSRLGESYRLAYDTVCRETGYLIYRFPGLDNCKYADGSPFADDDTKQWLKNVSLASGNAFMDLEKTDAPVQDDNRMAETIRKAKELAKQNKLIEAVKSLQNEWRTCFSPRQSLLWRLALSQIMVNAQQGRLAAPHLEQILQDIEVFRLEEWDPELALKGFKVVWVGFNNHPHPSFKEKAEYILARITKLDPSEALRLDSR